jgi:hypothetical protein
MNTATATHGDRDQMEIHGLASDVTLHSRPGDTPKSNIESAQAMLATARELVHDSIVDLDGPEPENVAHHVVALHASVTLLDLVNASLDMAHTQVYFLLDLVRAGRDPSSGPIAPPDLDATLTIVHQLPAAAQRQVVNLVLQLWDDASQAAA